MAIDVDEIRERLDMDFSCYGDVKIDPVTGRVDVNGELHPARKMDRLSVEFGNVRGPVYFQDIGLITLEGSPRRVTGRALGGGFYCHDNKLTSLVGAPRTVYGIITCHTNPSLASLEGLPDRVDEVNMAVTPGLGLLRLVMVKALKEVVLWQQGANQFHPAADIIKKYLGTGRAGVMPCAAELHKAGLGEHAKL